MVANIYMPSGILGWGGFGVIIGSFLVPVVAISMHMLVSNGGAALGGMVGLMFVSLVNIHASEVPVALAMGVVTGMLARQRRPPGRTVLPAILAATLVFAVAAGSLMVQLATEYARDPASTLSLIQGLDRYLRAGGQWGPLQVLMVMGLVVGFSDRSTRSLAALSLALGVLSVTLGSVRDPVSLFVAAPFLREPTRVLYLQMFVLPPLMARALLWLRDRLTARRPRLAGWVLAMLVAGVVVPGAVGVAIDLHNLRIAHSSPTTMRCSRGPSPQWCRTTSGSRMARTTAAIGRGI